MQPDIASEFSWLGDGEIATKQVCPRCGGGSQGEKSLSVGRSGATIWWKCHRASCRGGVGSSASLQTGNSRPAAKRGLRYYTRKLSPEQETFIKTKVGDTYAGRVLYTDSYGGRYCLPIISRSGRVVGHVLRSYEESSYSKALTDIQDGYSGCSWHGAVDECPYLCVVEDIPSAAKISESGQVVGVALLGTNINAEKLDDISAARPVKVMLCLDADATGRAVVASIAYRHLVSMTVMPITKDIKDMNEDEISSIVSEITNHDQT